MSKKEPFPLTMRQKMAIFIYLDKMKKPYTRHHFTILKKRGILKANGRCTLVGDILFKMYNGGKDYAQRAVPRRKRATKKYRKT